MLGGSCLRLAPTAISVRLYSPYNLPSRNVQQLAASKEVLGSNTDNDENAHLLTTSI